MSHAPHPDMTAILAEQRAAPAPDLTALPLPEARAAFARIAEPWNLPSPALERRAHNLGGVPCRLLTPPGAEPGAGLLVFVHGGGWTFGAPQTHDRFAALLAQAVGAPVLLPDYRLAPEHPCPAAIEDILAVLGALPSLPGRLGGKLVLSGDSAGGTIALAATLAGAAPRPALLSLLYGCFAPDFDTISQRDCGDGAFGLTTERMRWYWRNWQGPVPDPRAAPLHGDLAGLPPVHLLAAGLDPLRDDSIALAGRLAGAGVPMRLDVIPGVVDGFLQMTARLAPARDATALVASRIRRALRQGPPLQQQ